MQLPRTTHLQFLILGALQGGPTPGRVVRNRLEEFDVRRSAPAFYQVMARLEDGGMVTGWYEQQVIDGQIIRERHYRITPDGARAWAETRDFYRSQVDGEEGLANA